MNWNSNIIISFVWMGITHTADIRVFSDSNYFIPREEVDKFANEVRGHMIVKANAVSPDDQEECKMSLMTFPSSILKTAG